MWKAMTPKLLPVITLKICLLLAAALKGVIVEAKPLNMVKPGCRGKCGKVSIPFPFGIGPGCFLDPWFEIECKASSTNHSKGSRSNPFLSKFHLEVLDASDFSAYPVPYVIVRIPPLNVCSADTQTQKLNSNELRGSPYTFPSDRNVFMMQGCPGSAVLVNERDQIIAGCSTDCHHSNTSIPTNKCYGVQCCLTPFDSYQTFPNIQFYEREINPQTSGVGQNCLVAALIMKEYVYQYAGKLSSSYSISFPPVKLLWAWPRNIDWPHNPSHATCHHDAVANSTTCYCNKNCFGDPHLPNGCKVLSGCEGCEGVCLPKLNGTGNYCEKNGLFSLGAIPGIIGIVGGGILLPALMYGLHLFIKRRMGMKRRAYFFKKNGGLLLQKQLSSNDGIVERMKIFTVSELKKATNKFNENRILGQGGQGTVYKGMLTDGSIVAIKKSKLPDKIQLEQFINEVVILSRVNHRHVVKLFGCCLETEIPLLVYEFIPNGTLYQHIHRPDEDLFISWETRLKIAADSAGAIAYLHSSSSTPVYHRDIKSLNILLDERHRAKVSDFGSSKTIVIDQTHATTGIQGTTGYMDPEYFQSCQFTEKSDVYSFGVVLLELLTSKKPVFKGAGTEEQKNLVVEFQFLTQNSRLLEILDPEIVKQAKEDELTSVIELTKRCVSWSGRLRPTMKEVAMTLERIMKSPAQVSAWYQQQEPFPIQYAAYDDFDMTDIHELEFTSVTTPLPAGASSPLYTDEHCLLPNAI